MKKEIEAEFCKRFPSIFRDYGGDMRVTCMHWGLDVQEGWRDLLWNLCLFIENVISNSKSHIIHEYKTKNNINYSTDLSSEVLKDLKVDEMAVIADQVKEKYGGLRFYFSAGNLPERYQGTIDGAVSFAETMSYSICEVCGEKGALRGPGWLFTACDKHSRDTKSLKEYQEWEDSEDKKKLEEKQ